MATPKPFYTIFLLLLMTWTGIGPADDTSPVETKPKSWNVMLQIVYSPRAMDGTIRYNKGGPSDYLATADTLGLDTVDSFQYMMALKYKRWTLGVNYAPVTFEGNGYGYDLISIGSVGVVGGWGGGWIRGVLSASRVVGNRTVPTRRISRRDALKL